MVETERREPKDTVHGEGAERKKTSGVVGGEQHGEIENMTGGDWYVNRKETSLGQ